MFPVYPQSHTFSQLRPPSLSQPLFPFISLWFLLGLSSCFLTLPAHPPNSKGFGNSPLQEWLGPEPPHTPCFCPWLKDSEWSKAGECPSPSLFYSCPSGREPEDAPEQPAAALCLPGGQAVEAAAGKPGPSLARAQATRAGRGRHGQAYMALRPLGAG